jgi:hypothetical protein
MFRYAIIGAIVVAYLALWMHVDVIDNHGRRIATLESLQRR